MRAVHQVEEPTRERADSAVNAVRDLIAAPYGDSAIELSSSQPANKAMQLRALGAAVDAQAARPTVGRLESSGALMQKDAFDLFCPTCNILVEAKVIARGSGGFRSDAVNPLDEVDTEYHGEHYSVALCRRCDGPFLIRESLFGVPGEFETVTEEKLLFPITAVRNLEGVPKSVQRSMEQADRSFATGSYDAAALMCRRALEAVCRTLSAAGSNLALKLRDLHEKGHIDQKLLRWADGVRLIGNDAAHEVDQAVAKEDASDILDLTAALLMYVFSLDKKFREFESRRTAGA